MKAKSIIIAILALFVTMGCYGQKKKCQPMANSERHVKLPCAVLVHNKSCYGCPQPEYDTLCHFSYEDITLTDSSITFRDMECIYHYNDKDNPKRVNYLHGTYLHFLFPDGRNYTLELYSFYSSFTPVYAQILYMKEFGNTLPLDKRFFKKDWSKEVAELVKKWNQYADINNYQRQ